MGASIKVLIHLALFEFERAILIVIVRGTDKTIPTGPKTQPQNNKDKKTTKVDKPNPWPKILGSRILPIVIFITK